MVAGVGNTLEVWRILIPDLGGCAAVRRARSWAPVDNVHGTGVRYTADVFIRNSNSEICF